MNTDTGGIDYEKLEEQIYSYFPDCNIVGEFSKLKTADGSEILIGPEQILPYLQTILIEEHLVEIQLDFTTRLFFANLLDDVPELSEKEMDGEILIEECDYETGSYLKLYRDIVLTALTPGMGNVKIQSCKQVIVRFFTGTSAIELCSSYLQRDTLCGVPVLRLAYPRLGRVNRSYRSFRVKAVSTVLAQVCVNGKNEQNDKKIFYQIVDISAMGAAFSMVGDVLSFDIGDNVGMEIKVDGLKSVMLSGNVRHISKVRNRKGNSTICGVQFDLETRSVATDIEQLVATIQRLQLREIAAKTSSLDGVQLIK